MYFEWAGAPFVFSLLNSCMTFPRTDWQNWQWAIRIGVKTFCFHSSTFATINWARQGRSNPWLKSVRKLPLTSVGSAANEWPWQRVQGHFSTVLSESKTHFINKKDKKKSWFGCFEDKSVFIVQKYLKSKYLVSKQITVTWKEVFLLNCWI